MCKWRRTPSAGLVCTADTPGPTLQRFIDDYTNNQKIDCAEPGRCAIYMFSPDGIRPPGGRPLLELVPLAVN